MAPKKKARTT